MTLNSQQNPCASIHFADVEVRDITPDEHDFLPVILREAVFFPFPEKKQEKLKELEAIFENYFDGFGRRGDHAVVASLGGDLIGACWTRILEKKEGDHGFIDSETPELSVAVFEPYRDRGIGTQLINEICDRLRRDGFKKVSLTVDTRNPSINLYHRLGFEESWSNGHGCTMCKRLA